MGVAAERIAAALRTGETILVHGDYDVDGICGTVLLVRSLRMMGARVQPFVPDRLGHGYDLRDPGIAAAKAAGASLIVTTDCGIVAHAAVDEANRSGIDVIVTDHHTPGATLPGALAVVNPNRVDCGYPDKGLCGAAVAFKLAEAVATEAGFPTERLGAFLDLVAIATIADLAPLNAENRALVRWGLKVLSRTPNPGLRALIRTAGLGEDAEITPGQVGFVLAPRLNAAGRVADPMMAVRLLLTDNPIEADRLAATLEYENRRRKELDEETFRDAMEILERDYDEATDWGVVLTSERWHPGVIGIVASRIVERIHRPVVLIAVDGAEGKGSARSIAGFHLHEAFVACATHMIRFGGHRAAAGCSIAADRIESFRAAFNATAHRMIRSAEGLTPKLRIDTTLTLDEADSGLLSVLRHFAPFGIANPTPVFAALGVGLAAPPQVVGRGHLKLLLQSGGARLTAIGFDMAERIEECRRADRFDVAFRLEENEWRGADGRLRHGLQARLADLRVVG
jgi:single-stranded-DNA-specific exonuclease